MRGPQRYKNDITTLTSPYGAFYEGFPVLCEHEVHYHGKVQGLSAKSHFGLVLSGL